MDSHIPQTEYLWSWRLKYGYFNETDDEIDTKEKYINDLVYGERVHTWNAADARWDVQIRVGV